MSNKQITTQIKEEHVNVKMNPNGKMSEIQSKQSFESFIVEFKGNRENVMSILKIVIDQQKTAQFRKFLSSKKEVNQILMKDFMKDKYFEFVGSIQNINECKMIVKGTDDNLMHLEEAIQNFISEFSVNYLQKLKKKEEMMNIRTEKERLNIAYILFAYLNKAKDCLEDQQFEMTIRFLNMAQDKYLAKFPISSAVFKRAEQFVISLKNKITQIVEEKLTTWLVEINKEQNLIGESLFKKLKSEREKMINCFKYEDQNNLEGGKEFLAKTSILSETTKFGGKISDSRVTKSIVDNLLLIRNTSNLNYMMNKNSLLKSSVLNQADILEEFDIINMVSNVNLNFLEQAYRIYKKVDNDTKFIEHFINFRQSQMQTIIKLNNEGVGNKVSKRTNTEHYMHYETYFSEILGFIIIQIAVYELLPMFYTKRKFEEIMNYLIKELLSNLSFEFDTLVSHEDCIALETSIFIFLSSLERIGIFERTGIDIKSSLLEMMKEKIKLLNFTLIKRYNNYFVNLLFEEKCVNIEVKNQDDFLKMASQYCITLDDNSKPISGYIYPFKLPYTDFVVKVNENFKKYVDEIFAYVEPLYTDYETVMHDVVRDFIKKINEVFHTFSNFQEHDLNIILAAQICNNIRFIFKSHNFYAQYVMQKCNIKNTISFDTERAFKESCQNYEEIIYENLKKKFKHFISDLQGESWLPERANSRSNMYIDGMTAYISTIYVSLQTLSPFYIEFCFREAIRFLPKIYLEDILFNSHVVKAYNIFAIENLKIDIETLDNFCKNISLTHPGFDDCLLPIKNLISLFFTKKVEYFVEINKKLDSFYQVKIDSLCKFLLRYKNTKKSSDIKGKMTEAEVPGLIKKLRELK